MCTIRDPAATLVSWYSFLKGKDVPPLRQYWADGGGGVSSFARNPKFFAEDMRFGATLWDMYGHTATTTTAPLHTTGVVGLLTPLPGVILPLVCLSV